MRFLLAAALGLAFAANGVFMLAAPLSWYGAVPGVVDTGPFNAHFVRDIGCAFLVAGAAYLGFAFDARARMAALAGGAFLMLHALVHLWDAAAGRETLDHLMGDFPAVFAAPALALWLAWPRPRIRKEMSYVEVVDRAADRRL